MAKMVGISLKKRDTTWDRLSWKFFWRQYTLVRYPCLGEFCLPHFQDVPRFFGEKKFTILSVLLKLIWKKHFYSDIVHFSAGLGLDPFPSHPTLLLTTLTRQLFSLYAQDVLRSVADIFKKKLWYILSKTVKIWWAEIFSKKTFPTKNEMFRENGEEFCILKKITSFKIDFVDPWFSSFSFFWISYAKTFHFVTNVRSRFSLIFEENQWLQ